MANLMQEIYRKKTWGQLAQDFIEAITHSVNDAIARQEMKMVRKIIAAAVIFLGAIYFLSGLAVFIGELINSHSWSGYLLVGLVLLVAGAITFKVK